MTKIIKLAIVLFYQGLSVNQFSKHIKAAILSCRAAQTQFS